MGWFIGISGNNQSLRQKITTLTSSAEVKIEMPWLSMYAGGLSSTIFHHTGDGNSGWVVSGIGITNGSSPRLIKEAEWDHLIRNEKFNANDLNGHFAIAKWSGGKIDLFTDQLGLRNVYIHQGEDYTLFCTRLDWILKLIADLPINWSKFGSRWLSINQYASESFITGIERLSQGGKASLTDRKLVLTNKRYDYSQKSITPNEFINELHDFTTLPINDGHTLSLGLSGGLDSRTLFATLLKSPEMDWGLHSFGDRDHPDMKIAQELNSKFKRPHYVIHEEIPDPGTLSDLIPDFIGQTLFTSSPSHLVGFQAYKKLANLRLSVIDGGFGEIARRRFMVSVLLRAKQAVIDKNVEVLLPFFKMPRADIFNEDCIAKMEEGLREEFFQEIDAMPVVESIGIENWLDLFTIRTRVPNAAGPEQARSDSYLFNYMPFLQPQLIQSALNLPINHRKNASLFRTLIHDSAPELEYHPLVKGDITYPYWMKDVSSAVWMRIKQKIGMTHTSTREIDFLYTIENYVRDLFQSRSAKEFDAYDFRKVEDIIHGFYDEKNSAFSSQLNWLLAFEVFRKLNDQT